MLYRRDLRGGICLDAIGAQHEPLELQWADWPGMTGRTNNSIYSLELY